MESLLVTWSRETVESWGAINVFGIDARRRLDPRLQTGEGSISVNCTVPTGAALDSDVPTLGNCNVPPEAVPPEAESTEMTAESRSENRLAFRLSFSNEKKHAVSHFWGERGCVYVQFPHKRPAVHPAVAAAPRNDAPWNG